MGLIAFLNEECVRPGGSDKGFVTKAAAMNKDNTCFVRENSYTDHQFGIQHYAGRVVYDAIHFVTKNMDTLPTDLQDCATKSTNTIIANEFMNVLGSDDASVSTTTTSAPAVATTTAARRRAPSALVTTSTSIGNMTSPTKRNKGGSNLMGETVWSKFRNQLTTLMTNLKSTKTRYIRCIKPNTMKQPYIMQHLSTVEQLRCAGVVAAVTISRSAFPNRLEHDVILDRFKSLWIKGEQVHYPISNVSIDPNERSKDMVRQLLTSALKSLERSKDNGATVVQAFVLGKTRTYFRSGALEYLEHERIRCLSKWAIVIQRIVRTYVIQSHYVRIRKSIITLQSGIRMAIVRHNYTKQRMDAISMQCWIRQMIAVRVLVQLRRNFNATKVQSHWRMLRFALDYKHKRRSAIVLQKIIRGALQRPKYKMALIERREEAKLENQVIALQRKLEEAERRRMEAEKKAEEKAQAQVVVSTEVIREKFAPKSPEEKKDDEKNVVADAESETSSLTNPDEPKTPHGLSSQQQALMDESGKMLEYLRKEVFKLRSHNAQLHSDFNLLKDNNQRLMDANASAGASFAALNQHAKKLSKVNEKLTADIQSYKQQVQKLSVTQVELKEELKMKQATYVAEVHSRLQYQKALTKIIDVAQDRCRDDRLVEDFLRIADSCEAEYMNGPTGMNARAGSSLFSPPRAGSKPNNATTNSDSGVLSSFRKMWS
jgi:myosin heavy subunit